MISSRPGCEPALAGRAAAARWQAVYDGPGGRAGSKATALRGNHQMDRGRAGVVCYFCCWVKTPACQKHLNDSSSTGSSTGSTKSVREEALLTLPDVLVSLIGVQDSDVMRPVPSSQACWAGLGAEHTKNPVMCQLDGTTVHHLPACCSCP